MRDHLDQLSDALPVVFTFTDDPQRLAAYREHLDIEFPVLTDAIVGCDGRLGRVWLPPNPDARPSLDAIVDAVQESERRAVLEQRW